ncbi:acyl n-acyltransferase [Fusarium beomiforme]|uniref:Acyl n-acyltransferase n=1 Tax=Fusarium beomiforme TaxID=44412 RepID=A0A9P5DYS6_9HYPO|nr:acyl n-acyltransferase [Fusarium beomiforme]
MSGALSDGSTPSPNIHNSLLRIQGMRNFFGNQAPSQQLLPPGVVQQRILGSQRTSTSADSPAIQQTTLNSQKVLDTPLPLQAPENGIARIPPHRRLSKEPACTSPSSPRTPVNAVVRALMSPQTPEIVDSEGTDDFEHSSVGTWNSPKEEPIGDASSEIGGAPLPAPLHIIQAAATSTAVVLRQHSFSTASMALGSGPLSSDEETSWNIARADGHQDNGEMTLVRANQYSVAAIQEWWEIQDRYPVFDLAANRHPRVDDCDIHPATGQLIPPPRYIKIQKDSQAKHHWRRAVTHSEGFIARELDLRQAKKKEIERKVQENKYKNMSYEDDKWPDAGCTLRPVEVKDFQGIADIINNEQQRQDSQVFLSQKVDCTQITRLYYNCLSKHRPFIVAVESSSHKITDRSGWSKADEMNYQKFLEFMKSSGAADRPTILGFAFVTNPRQDFLGNACNGARFSGEIKLLVDPSHRKRLVGSALLDRILLCTSIYHRSLVDYTWDCSTPRKTYEEIPAHNQQKYTKLYLETFFNGGNDPRIKWITSLLEKYDFGRVGNFKDAVKHGKHPGVWKDLAIWEHDSRPTNEIQED